MERWFPSVSVLPLFASCAPGGCHREISESFKEEMVERLVGKRLLRTIEREMVEADPDTSVEIRGEATEYVPP